MESIEWSEFVRIELCAGTIVGVEDFSEARLPAYKITVDFGPEIGVRKTSARVTDLYAKEDLVGKQCIGVVNLAAKQIGPILSEFLLTGFEREGGAVVLAVPERPVANGARLV
jgi:tRNA-binding protein